MSISFKVVLTLSHFINGIPDVVAYCAGHSDRISSNNDSSESRTKLFGTSSGSSGIVVNLSDRNPSNNLSVYYQFSLLNQSF